MNKEGLWFTGRERNVKKWVHFLFYSDFINALSLIQTMVTEIFPSPLLSISSSNHTIVPFLSHISYSHYCNNSCGLVISVLTFIVPKAVERFNTINKDTLPLLVTLLESICKPSIAAQTPYFSNRANQLVIKTGLIKNLWEISTA